MGLAPTPGSRAADEQARKFLRIRVKDQTLDVMPDLTLDERFVVRHATGLPVDAFTATEQAFGLDSLFVLWWLGRRQNGEPGLPFKQAKNEWPAELGVDDIDLDEIDLADDPEVGDSPE